MKSALAVLILFATVCIAETPKTFHAEYSCSRDALIGALSQVVADNAWHFDSRDDKTGDFRIGVPGTPMWQGKLVVYVSSVDSDHQQITIYREKSGTAGAKKVADKLIADLSTAIEKSKAK